MELVKGMEEFLLGAFLTYNKLDIIDQQYVHSPVFIPEPCHGTGITASNGFDYFICELLGCYIDDLPGRILFQNEMTD